MGQWAYRCGVGILNLVELNLRLLHFDLKRFGNSGLELPKLSPAFLLILLARIGAALILCSFAVLFYGILFSARLIAAFTITIWTAQVVFSSRG